MGRLGDKPVLRATASWKTSGDAASSKGASS